MKLRKKNKKSGFTLVELMVVAIIVAILAAVAIPMMTGNTEEAMASEGRTGCGAVATQIRMHFVQTGSAPANLAALSGITADDLLGTYFDTYTIDVTDKNNYTVTAVGRGDAAGESVVMNVANGITTWQGLGGEAIPD
ncbi:prepilin-type N-terminal cleavage/methylation domain-containing protein [Pontiellaceae bacterium B12227]|nr:prepilin-type N-terminal cleavage/methylation domain-containing protein [Pontiellaceae bacterium B12227]